ncbi:MBL fold metallo-hydrolase [Candidatus Bathyarchaeota archaeon]|nr:MBL fold metallo-hydrolase [Candidatus Bathyarchaeota archaeon]
MIKEILPNFFQIRVPLPRNPLGHLNAYLIKSFEKNFLIDTGLNSPEAFEVLCHDLSEIGVELQMLTDILFTHFHIDHIGMIPRFKQLSKNHNLWIHHTEKELLSFIVKDFSNYLDSMKRFLEASDAPATLVNNLQKFHPAFFTPEAYEEIARTAHPLIDGQKISLGDYHFQVLWTPGHSPGHICLYEPYFKVLISGDHILPTITPHVSQFMADTNPLKDYLKSLRKVESLDVKLVLPAHEKSFMNLSERVKQLRNHHKQRLKEVLNHLSVESLSPYNLASKIQWNVNYKSWNNFPPFQKYLALGETMSHLTFLEKRGLVKRVFSHQKILYEISKTSRFSFLISPFS